MKASDWISVKDRLPKNGEKVLVLREYNGEQIAEVAMRTRWYWNEDCFDCDNVTHWQEIVLPKKKSYEPQTKSVCSTHRNKKIF